MENTCRCPEKLLTLRHANNCFMGIVDHRKGGILSGKSGDKVFFWRNGKQLFRTYVKPVNPQTPRQTEHRAKFAWASKVVSPLYGAMKRGHPDPGINFYSLCGRVLREAITGEYTNFSIDYSKIHIAEGRLQKPHPIIFRYETLAREVHFTWDNSLSGDPVFGSPTDKVSIVCFHETPKKEVRTFVSGTRNAGGVTFTLPDGWEIENTHFWLYLASHDGKEHSGSAYVRAGL